MLTDRLCLICVCVLLQLGHYGGMVDEIDALKRDKNVLMLELVRLRQQQQVRRHRHVLGQDGRFGLSLSQA